MSGRSEYALHVQVAAFLRLALRPPVMWSTFPAGGGGKARGGKLKAMGLAPGWPDMLVIAPGPNVIGIELKAAKGSASKAQRAIAEAFFDCTAWYALCRSVDEVEEVLRFCKVPLHATAGGRLTA